MPWLPCEIITTFVWPGFANRKPCPGMAVQTVGCPAHTTEGQVTASACSGLAVWAFAIPAAANANAAGRMWRSLINVI